MASSRVRRSGKIVVLSAILMPVLVGMGAFAIDLGSIEHSRAQVQTGADAAAIAVAEDLSRDQATLESVADQYVAMNAPTGSNVDVTVETGIWDDDAGTFTLADAASSNAARVSVKLVDKGLSFGALLGQSAVDVEASAIATKNSSESFGTLFMFDEEFIDKDVESLEDLANDLGIDGEELVTARGFNDGKEYGDSDWTWEDNFLDIPADTVLTLPTGQGEDYENNDSGMFTIDHPDFPFTDDTQFKQFLMYSETGNDSSKWGTDTTAIYNNLDPLQGVSPVYDGSTYSSFVDENFTHVSPILPSDISTLNMRRGQPRVNAKGLRRGLLAFKIIGVGNDPDGNGSVLPELIIKIVDPSTFTIDDVKPYSQVNPSAGGAAAKLVK